MQMIQLQKKILPKGQGTFLLGSFHVIYQPVDTVDNKRLQNDYIPRTEWFVKLAL